MTNGQKCILKYLRSQFGANVRWEPIGNDVIRFLDSNGGACNYSMNIFGDILDMDAHKVIAISDLSHRLDQIGMYDVPSCWLTR